MMDITKNVLAVEDFVIQIAMDKNDKSKKIKLTTFMLINKTTNSISLDLLMRNIYVSRSV
jgi:Holliday junction resolvasome RuvABC ATP-dependent DNA helicase subunit